MIFALLAVHGLAVHTLADLSLCNPPDDVGRAGLLQDVVPEAQAWTHLVQAHALKLLLQESGSRNGTQGPTPAPSSPAKAAPSSTAAAAAPAAAPPPPAATDSTGNFGVQLKAGSAQQHEEILARNGYFLGASRDTWIVLAIVLVGLVLSGVLIQCTISNATQYRADIILSETLPKRVEEIKAPSFPVDFLRRVILMRDRNPSFADNASLAMRCALNCALIGLTYWVPALSSANSKGWSMQYVVVIIAFSVYADMGTTAKLAWLNFYGTLLPTCNVFLMYGLYPRGTSGPDGGVGSSAFIFGVIDFIAFCSIFLVLKWPIGVRMFALSWQAYFSMCFLNPTDDTVFSRGLTDIILEGAAVGPLVGTVFGCVISVAITAPGPLHYSTTALGEAQEATMAAAWEEAQQWCRVVRIFLGKHAAPDTAALCRDAEEVRTILRKLDGLLESSWFECFDHGRPGQIRAHLLVLRQRLRNMHDWLFAGMQGLLANSGSSERRKAELQEVGSQLDDLCEYSALLLYRAAGLACSGFTPEGAKEKDCNNLLDDIKAVSGIQQELAKQLVQARKKVYGEGGMSAEVVQDHTLVMAVSAFAKQVVEFAEYLLQGQERVSALPTPGSPVMAEQAFRAYQGPEFEAPPRTTIVQACREGILDVFHFNEFSFFFRSSLAFFLAWFLGYIGWRNIFQRYGSTAAGTTAFLMAAEGQRGSAIVKNVARFQGVAAGSVLGLVLYRGVVICDHGGAALAACAFGLFEFFAFYLYFASSSYGYIGLLLAAFGAEGVLLDCGEVGRSESQNVFNTLMDQTAAILCVTLADLVVGNTSAAAIATNDFFGVMQLVKASLERFLGSGKAETVEEAKTFSSNISTKISMAVNHGMEAALEPRLNRVAFKSDLWENLCRCGAELSHKVCIMEYLEAFGTSAGSSNLLTVLHDVPALRVEAQELDERAETCLRVAKLVMLNDTALSPGVSPQDVEKLLRPKSAFKPVVEATLKEVRKALVDPAKGATLLESVMHEDLARAEVLLCMLWGVHKNLSDMEDLTLTSDCASLQQYFAYKASQK